jgi:hypothetical protein
MCLLLSACGEESEPLITEGALREGTYLTQFAEGGHVTLTEGLFESPAVEGAMPDLTVSLDRIAMGDLNGDERQDAAVVLVERMNQMNALYNLHAVLAADSTLTDAAWVLLGARPTRVGDVRVDSGLIYVDLLGREEEPGARSSVRSVVYALTDKGLRVVDTPGAGRAREVPVESSEPVDGSAPAQSSEPAIALSGAEWDLVSIEMEDEVVTPVFSARGDPSLVFTREFGDPDFGSGRMSGQAGCNRIFGSYRVGPADSLSISSIAMTYMSCPEPVMEIERLLARALELVRTYRRAGDELVLEFVDGRLRLAASDS